MKLVALGLLVCGLVVACSTEQHAREEPLVTSSGTEAPDSAEKSDVGDAIVLDASTSSDASEIVTTPSKDNTFAITRACGDAGECTFTANVTSDANAAVSSACNTIFTRGAACGAFGEHPDAFLQVGAKACAAFGHSMKPEMEKQFDCEADEVCGGELTGCVDFPTTTLGDDICKAATTACGADEPFFDCGADNRDTWNGAGGELREDAVAAGRSCLAYTCADLRACLDAWQTAIGLPSTAP